MLGAFAVDRTLICDTERTRLARPDLMPAHLDLQPAVAAGRAVSAGSLTLLVQIKKPLIVSGQMVTDWRRARKSAAGATLMRKSRFRSRDASKSAATCWNSQRISALDFALRRLARTHQ
jgi:hypothetical protein